MRRKFSNSWIVYLLSLLTFISCKTVSLSDAEEMHRVGEYYQASELYRKLYAKASPNERDLRGYLAFRIGDCSSQLGKTERAINAYQNAIRYEYPDSTIYLQLAQMLQRNGKYKEAIGHYEDYLRYNPNNHLAANGILGCQLAPHLLESPTLYQVKRAELFNSNCGEFSPMLLESRGELYFASSRGRLHKDSINNITGQKNNSLYVAKKNEQGAWIKPQLVEGPINTQHDLGTPSFSSDGNTLYYTHSEQDLHSTQTAQIYVSTRSGGQWGKGRSIQLAKDSLTMVAHPSISPDGKYLYFVSDAAGGMGGKDIYRAKRIDDKTFGKWENLGAAINTPGDEMFPFVKDSVTIYFSSNGHPGMGGLDLFKATLNSNGLWMVENLGTPINSMGDDFGITFEKGKEKGFFSSNRKDARGYDHLYTFEYPEFSIYLQGTVFDYEDHPLSNALLHIIGSDGLNVQAPTAPDGSYKVKLEPKIQYVMMAKADGYLNQNFQLETENEEKNITYTIDFFLSPVDKPVEIENIFYDFDQSTLRAESKAALDGLIKLLNDNPHAGIQLRAHTDRKGSSAYNINLSQQRAQAVTSYLIQAGISPDRLTAKGFGKTEPKIINTRLAAVYPFLKEGEILDETLVNSLPEEQQEAADQLNRRTEFQVTGLNFK